ncbi:MAG: biotin--[acetyl-CoA-carboxylase] ligase [Acholeplasmataceae bacterium]|nr:biotin--[acetyl-CoA-carboxylase] ligase [Acholeplasmataceae bacterium]
MEHTIIEFEKLTSTSNFLKEKYLDFPSFTMVRSDFQTKGRGQFDRTWESLPRKNLLFSLLLKNIPFHQLEKIKTWMINQLNNLLVSFNLDVEFKPPNDLYVDDKKICGILIETKTGEGKFEYVIIGVGLNVNQLIFRSSHATSIRVITKKKTQISALFHDFSSKLLHSYQKLE